MNEEMANFFVAISGGDIADEQAYAQMQALDPVQMTRVACVLLAQFHFPAPVEELLAELRTLLG